MLKPQAIRPKVLFNAIETRFPNLNNSFTVNIPSPDLGGMTLLESSILVCLAKLTHATQLFEFGTFMGATTLLLAENSPQNAQVVTLDIPPHELQSLDAQEHGNDQFLREQFTAEGARCIRRATPNIQHKVQQILNNSLTLNLAEHQLEQRFDFIFIDGGHHEDIVRHDTANAYRMAKRNAVIAWHDYNSTLHPDVTHFLNQHAETHTLYHVEHTMIAFELLGDFQNLISPTPAT